MNKRQLLVATRNKGKFAVFQRELEGFPFILVSLDQTKSIPKNFEVEEKGTSFKENAVLKARVYGRLSGLLTLADDSGLEVQALSGRPGVYSSRYAKGTDRDKYRQLLEEMKDIPDGRRRARFYCVLAVYEPRSGKLRTFTGSCQGIIARQPKGRFGFGYDPVFFLPQLKRTVAQLTPAEKNLISHRGRALRKAKRFLKTLV